MRTLAINGHRAPLCAKQIAAGNETAFTMLYKTVHQDLFTHAYHLTQCREASEELVQEVFLKLWVNRDKLQEVSDLYAYVFQMGRNVALSYLLSRKRQAAGLKGYAHWKGIDKITACRIEQKELAKVVNKSITCLPHRQRTVFHLRKNLHWRRSEIALALAISPFTVKTTLQNALGRIRKDIQTYTAQSEERLEGVLSERLSQPVTVRRRGDRRRKCGDYRQLEGE